MARWALERRGPRCDPRPGQISAGSIYIGSKKRSEAWSAVEEDAAGAVNFGGLYVEYQIAALR